VATFHHVKLIILPRQARDKHIRKASTQNQDPFSCRLQNESARAVHARGDSRGVGPNPAAWLRDDSGTETAFEFSLCLSRACLGKIIVFIYKWLKNRRLSHVFPKNDRFTKTGSGQTSEKWSEKGVLCRCRIRSAESQRNRTIQQSCWWSWRSRGGPSRATLRCAPASRLVRT
jgi:hypothetical protein